MSATTDAGPTVTIEADRLIDAPAATVYPLIADYHTHHPRILPPAISDLRVEEGGTGAGTVITFDVKLGGRMRHFRARITEPVPGRVLEETDLISGTSTNYEVQPVGSGCVVRIRTRLPLHRAPLGWLERAMAPRMLRKLYQDELVKLERYAQSQPEAPDQTPSRRRSPRSHCTDTVGTSREPAR